MVVAGRVEALARGVQHRRVEVGVEDSLLVPERAGEDRAVRREGRATIAGTIAAEIP